MSIMWIIASRDESHLWDKISIANAIDMQLNQIAFAYDMHIDELQHWCVILCTIRLTYVFDWDLE